MKKKLFSSPSHVERQTDAYPFPTPSDAMRQGGALGRGCKRIRVSWKPIRADAESFDIALRKLVKGIPKALDAKISESYL